MAGSAPSTTSLKETSATATVPRPDTRTTTIYLDEVPNGNFADPSYVCRRKAYPDNVAQTTSHPWSCRKHLYHVNVNTVTSAESFTVGESKFRLGQAGDQFRTFISGRGNTTGTPAGFVIAGYVVPIEKASPKRGDRLKKIAWLAGCSRKRAPHPSAQSFASVGKVCCSRSGHYSTASEGSASRLQCISSLP